MSQIAVASRSFSKNETLKKEILKNYPHVKFNDDGLSLYGDSLISFLENAEKAVIGLEKLDDEILSKLPKLKVISKYGVGIDTIDLEALNKFNIKLGWTSGVNKRSVSELVISSSIALLHKTTLGNSEIKKGKWYQIIGRQLTNATFGIIGCGNIGKDLVKLLLPFGCSIISYDINHSKEFNIKYDIKAVSLNELLESSDVISLHLPLNSSTQNILSEKELNLIKKDSILINFARGGLIDENYLKKIMSEKKLGGLALDVFEIEPLIKDDFSIYGNVLITPHMGGSTKEAVLAMGRAAIHGLENYKDPIEFLENA